jgi:hypothetical protein
MGCFMYESLDSLAGRLLYSFAKSLPGNVLLAVTSALSFGAAIFQFLDPAWRVPQSHPLSSSYLLFLGVSSGIMAIMGTAERRSELQTRRQELARLRANSLPDRAKHAAQVLQEATTLVEELQAELTARTALLEDVRRQVAETTERAADMARLSAVDEETTRVLNKYFDEALKHRLGELEHSARGREWLIGTVVAVAIGILAILFSHFVLGF